jgi:hypothetical protein
MSHYGAETGLNERASRRARNGSPARNPFPARTKTSLFNTTYDDPLLEGISDHPENLPTMPVSISGSSTASPVEGDANRRGSEASVVVVTAGGA